ncbi:MAG: Asp-tRNA(Asn)/Glu-tRNA(Gln) amidotransferase subunit GatC [Bacillota bacterium]|uniref:Aspartyl/glutamyl-tRNA(Asn/Gln) amidotransferase subunit C n=2 Tax=Fictibacillus TaxID=1329200 RepID=A0A160II15_9BACL|nr:MULTISPECIES: Asp-tRNA(Asn)/Glu-tRNA(Gln) amidotransferase subunit GatC [Fictibacillus]ANC75588.1 asparaginyl/glutamyl-tRNA amidotransferase subunit C [Fictibacillus phosphorivorans]MBD7965143.1 Asp-tRNA(Asn)/Glu-tRNA(Gln) amidotransferase subunit GatC [Fictibacillus norfolkensis]MBH0158083.1 Asp-tRNA(Asn)/Glu-tRNA(Gln) amidotransferase subunit GatC [Fictibacillus sp. 5RED26]MBH0167092.1 Asp-tRNA(Asn)/Glu-tRNA(Gln) amidotransferase subunit GatC [Fictibacillus sp. 7GRE50]MBH0171190.1 Asp-tRN
MSRISKDQVKHVAHLARLAVTEEEAELLTEQLDKIIGFAEELNELDTDNVEPTTHVLELKNILRKDEVRNSVSVDEAMKNAPSERDGQFKVPNILE